MQACFPFSPFPWSAVPPFLSLSILRSQDLSTLVLPPRSLSFRWHEPSFWCSVVVYSFQGSSIQRPPPALDRPTPEWPRVKSFPPTAKSVWFFFHLVTCQSAFIISFPSFVVVFPAFSLCYGGRNLCPFFRTCFPLYQLMCYFFLPSLPFWTPLPHYSSSFVFLVILISSDFPITSLFFRGSLNLPLDAVHIFPSFFRPHSALPNGCLPSFPSPVLHG